MIQNPNFGIPPRINFRNISPTLPQLRRTKACVKNLRVNKHFWVVINEVCVYFFAHELQKVGCELACSTLPFECVCCPSRFDDEGWFAYCNRTRLEDAFLVLLAFGTIDRTIASVAEDPLEPRCSSASAVWVDFIFLAGCISDQKGNWRVWYARRWNIRRC